MALVPKHTKKIVIDITGSKGNALHIAVYLSQFMGDEALTFVTSNDYITTVATLCHLFTGFDIVHDLSDDVVREVDEKVKQIKRREELEYENRNIQLHITKLTSYPTYQ